MGTNIRHPKIELRLGTRASLLALQQANWVKSQLEAHHPEVQITLVHIKTSGDKIDFPLFEVGGKGLFVKEIEEALLWAEVDLAVHSAKDLPAVIPAGLALMAFPRREDPRDAFISRNGRSWKEIPERGRVGTSSLRRQAQLRHVRPDLELVSLRGNLDTRLKKLTAMALDGIVLASAGLNRMGWAERVTEYFDPEIMLPAVGQGILAIEGRVGDERLERLLAPLNHYPTQIALRAERAFSKSLEGGCQVPVAGLATVGSEKVALAGLVAGTDGQELIKGRAEGTWERSEEVGEELARQLLARGADKILREVYKKDE